MSVWAVVGIFFFSFLQLLGPSLSLSFRLISKKEAPLFLSRAFDTSKKSNIFRREREQFFFFWRGNDTRHDPFNSLFLSLCSSSLKIVPPHNRYRRSIGRVTHPMRRSFAFFERRRSSSSRSTTTRENKRERKEKKHSEATRDVTKGSKNSWVRHIFFSFVKFFEAHKRKRTSRITQQPGRARVR